MEKLKWTLAFLLDVIVFTIAGLLITVFHLMVGLTTILMSTIKAILLFDGVYLLCCFKTLFDLLTKYPIDAIGITVEKLKESYDNPTMYNTYKENNNG